mmetsp:Transcript_6287/g.14930  ORF Transcript_6287/g.14930 Transcript_6287/m.14930 type:complete len:254 (-) Transcript_6287:605-1366(-)
MASSVGAPLERHDQALLQCILDELKLKGACCSHTAVPRSQFLSPGKCPGMDEETRSPSAASLTISPRSLRSTSPSASCHSSPQPTPAMPRHPVSLALSELLPPSACPSLSATSAPPTETSVVSWRVINPTAKFKASCGFPLVSPQLSTALLDDFRVIFAPGSAWSMAQSKGKKKEMACNKAAPLYGSLQIKFLSDDPVIRDLKLFFTIGSMRLGPFRTTPERSTSELCELPVDWRRPVDKTDTSFGVMVEMST